MSSKGVPPGSRTGRFSPEFKADAVSMVIDGDRSIVEVARGLGLVEQTLGNMGPAGTYRSWGAGRPDERRAGRVDSAAAGGRAAGDGA